MTDTQDNLYGPLEYGTCGSLEMARSAADEALREGLKGMYPASCVVLDMQVARLTAERDALRAKCEALEDVLESIASMYDYEKSCGDLASLLYEARCMARAALAHKDQP